jgi:1,4-dihydroxy-2-naphthoate octaprenyltransferase
MRAPFLVLDPALVLLGVGVAVWQVGHINWWHALLAFVGALAAHVSVNAFNEYSDFRSGLDLASEQTPFSGGSGTLRQRPDLARVALGIGLGALALAGVIGLFFVWNVGWGLFPLGLLGLVTIVLYTPWITHVALLYLFATGFGFGFLMINGINYVLTGHYTWPAFFGSLVEFFQGNALLLLNQYPDVEADRTVGRRNLPIVYGRKASSRVYGVLLLAVYASLVAGVVLRILPWQSLLLFLTFPLAFRTVAGVQRHADDMPGLIPFLGYNAVLNVVNPALVGIGLILAAVL